MNKRDLTLEDKELLSNLIDRGFPETQPRSKEVLPVDAWIRNPYYVGTLVSDLWPFWVDQLKEMESKDDFGIYELIITGSLSSGKSFFSLIVWLRLLYRFSKIKNLQKFLGLASTSRILMTYLSVSVKEAELTGFGEFRGLVDSIPYFNEEFSRNKNKDSILEFPNGVTFIAGSDLSHFLGAHLFSIIFDEANYARRGAGNYGDLQKAFDVYHGSRLRMKTRYQHQHSAMPGMNILVSSTTHQTSFTEQIIKSSRGLRGVKMINARLYDTRPEGSYSNEKFLFFVGNQMHTPQVIESKKDLNNLLPLQKTRSLSEPLDPDTVVSILPSDLKDRFTKVPVDFKDECKRYPKKAVTEIVGYSMAARDKFFDSILNYQSAVNLGEERGLKHPFTKEALSIGVGANYNLIDFLDVEYLKSIIGGKPCYMHIDQSTTHDSTGIALAFPDTIKGQVGVFVPLMLRIIPERENQISISRCRQFVEHLVAKGIPVVHVSFDSYQSSSSIQILNEKKIIAGRRSMDANDEPWIAVDDLFSSGRLGIYDYAPFKTELFGLIHDREKHKILHPEDNAKDVADGTVGAICNCWVEQEAKYVSKDIQQDFVNLMKQAGNDNLDSAEALTRRLLKVPYVQRPKVGNSKLF